MSNVDFEPDHFFFFTFLPSSVSITLQPYVYPLFHSFIITYVNHISFILSSSFPIFYWGILPPLSPFLPLSPSLQNNPLLPFALLFPLVISLSSISTSLSLPASPTLQNTPFAAVFPLLYPFVPLCPSLRASLCLPRHFHLIVPSSCISTFISSRHDKILLLLHQALDPKVCWGSFKVNTAQTYYLK